MKNEKMPSPILDFIVSTSDFFLSTSVSEVVTPTCPLTDCAITNSAVDSFKLPSEMALKTSSEWSIR